MAESPNLLPERVAVIETYDYRPVWLMADLTARDDLTAYEGQRAWLVDGTKYKYTGGSWTPTTEDFTAPYPDEFVGNITGEDFNANFRAGRNVYAPYTQTIYPEVTVDRTQELLDQRFGYAENVVGGSSESVTVVTDLTGVTGPNLITLLTESAPRNIRLHPGLTGQTMVMPAGNTVIGANKTYDATDADVIHQFGDAGVISTGADLTGSKAGKFVFQNGEAIFFGVKARGNSAATGYVANGNTEFGEVWDGQNYWFHHCEMSLGTDEGVSLYHNPDGSNPNLITVSFCKISECMNGSIVGNQWITDPADIMSATQAYNWIHDLHGGRCPGLYHSANAHVFHNVVENYAGDGALVVRQNAEVVSYGNVIKPGGYVDAVGYIAQGGQSGNNQGIVGKLSSSNDYFDNGAFSTIYNPNQNVVDSSLRFNPDIDYTHVKLAGITQAEIEAYVKANAGTASVLR